MVLNESLEPFLEPFRFFRIIFGYNYTAPF